MLAVRTGALCVGTERTVAAIRGSGLTLVHGETTTVAHPEAVERLETPVGLLVVAVKAHDLDDALDRIAPEALAGAVVLPLLNGLEHVEAIRARFEVVVITRSSAVVAGSIGRLEAFSPEPGVVVQRSAGNAVVNAASRELDRPALDAALEPLRVPGIDVVLGDDERAVLWEKAARLAVLAAATVASGLAVGPLRGRSDMARSPRGGARRGVRGRRRRRRHARRGRPMGDHRGHARRPHHVRGARRRVGTPDRARRDHGVRRPRRREARRADAGARIAPRGGGDAERDSADRRTRRLRARAGEERAPARRSPAARVRDRDGAAVGGLRPHRRLDRQRADRAGRPLVRRRRPVPPAGGVLDVDVAGHRVDRVDAAAARGALRPVRDRARDEPLPGAGRRSGAGSSSCSRHPRPTRSARSSGSSSIRGRCGSSTRSTA